MPPTPSTVKADPNVFAGAYLAGCEASNTPMGARLSALKENWHMFRDFIAWVADGSDVKDFEARREAIAKEEARRAEIARIDREAEERRRAAALEHAAS